MRRHISYLMILTLFLCSCARDLGNYDYIELDELSITGLTDCEVLMFDRLEFTPAFGAEDLTRKPMTSSGRLSIRTVLMMLQS